MSNGPSLAASTGPPARTYDVALLDLDGVVYVGGDAVPGAIAHLAEASAAGQHLCYVTNNAARTPGAIATHLRQLGLSLEDGDVVTSAQAAARLVADAVPAGSRVLVVGGAGLVEALAEHELIAVDSAADGPAAVVQGFHPSVGWRLLAEGAYAVASGVPWVASNTDRTVPTARGVAPGNGTLVAALQATTERTPVVAGKPEPALIEESVLRTGARHPLMIGDRLDTDIQGARRYGMPSLLVLTGVTTLEQLFAATGDERPDYVAADLGGLLVAHPEVRTSALEAYCGGWTADVQSGRLTLRAAAAGSSAASRPDTAVAALRAAVAAAWLVVDDDSMTGGVDFSHVVEQLQEMMGSATTRRDTDDTT